MRTRADIGRYAQRKGETFEQEIKRTNDSLSAKRLGVVEHCHAATKQSSGRILWQARGPFDWVGLLDGCIPVYFESKERDFVQGKAPSRYTLPERDEHQLVSLRNFASLGDGRALCFVLFNWRHLDQDGEIISVEMRLHPIETIPDRTVIRERGVLSANRNWYHTAISEEYRRASEVGFLSFDDDMDIPI